MEKSSGRRTLTFDSVRKVALSMPEVEETTGYGMPVVQGRQDAFRG